VNPRVTTERRDLLRPTTEPEHLSARWDAVNRRLEQVGAGRAHTPEGDDVGDEERGLLEELDRIEGWVEESGFPRDDR
jgi:hypothetical protein